MKNLNGKWNYILDSNSTLSICSIQKKVSTQDYTGAINVPSNWNYLGLHEGYFQEFNFLLDKSFVKPKGNILIVRVTAPIEEISKVCPDNKKLIKGIFNHQDCGPGG